MSGDFEEAILEGATIVRVGRALYEGTVDLATAVRRRAGDPSTLPKDGPF